MIELDSYLDQTCNIPDDYLFQWTHVHYWKVFSFTELKFFFKTGFYSVTKTSLELGMNLPQLGVKRVLTVDACFYRPVLRHLLSMILARGFGHT